MLPGFPTRLKKDIKDLFRARVQRGVDAPTSIKIRIIDPPTRKYNVFIGASIVAKVTDSFTDNWRTKKEYFEKGKERIAHEMGK
jgi:actin-related protein